MKGACVSVCLNIKGLGIKLDFEHQEKIFKIVCSFFTYGLAKNKIK